VPGGAGRGAQNGESLSGLDTADTENRHRRRAAVFAAALEPEAGERSPPDDDAVISPELILVASPEEARRAREHLPEQPRIAPARRPSPPPASATADEASEPTPEPGRLAPLPPRPPEWMSATTSPAPARPRPAEPLKQEPRRERPAPPSYAWATPAGKLDELSTRAAPARRRRLAVRGRSLLVTLAAVTVALGGYFALSVFRRDSPTLVAATRVLVTPARAPTPSRHRAEPKSTPHRRPPTPAHEPTLSRPATTATKTMATVATPTATSRKPVTPTPAPTARPKPRSTPNPKPEPVSGFVPTRNWGWPAQPGADGYQVTFLVDSHVVFRTRTTEPHLSLPRSFRFRAGAWRWKIVALPANPDAQPIVDSTFVLTKAAAAAANALSISPRSAQRR
jgi:hypothetical protein